MAEINTTSINDLPTDPANGGSIGGSVSLVANESSLDQMQSQSSNMPMSLDQSTISQIVNGLQQASLAGATQLPSRDIPLKTEQLTHDEHTQPNYIPPATSRDYILEPSDDIQHYYNREKIENSLDSVYDEIQGPLLLAILYFLFQLPIFKKLICKYLPFLCHNDGNYNIRGLFFTCLLFGFIYYSLAKTVTYFGKF
jgi:hypothetical protein